MKINKNNFISKKQIINITTKKFGQTRPEEKKEKGRTFYNGLAKT